MLFDTDILIWLFRKNEKAGRVMDSDPDRAISIVTFMELLQGARDKTESRLTKDFIKNLALTNLPITENISFRASIYIEEIGLSSGLRVTDALIAATAAEYGLPLCTGDQAHFRRIRDLNLILFRP
jgi:hypothetical protein